MEKNKVREGKNNNGMWLEERTHDKKGIEEDG